MKNEEALIQALGKPGQSRIANNLNQVAYEANCGSYLMDEETKQELKLACSRIAWIRVKLIEVLGLESEANNPEMQSTHPWSPASSPLDECL